MDDPAGVRIAGGVVLGYALFLRGELPDQDALVATVSPLARQGAGSPFMVLNWLGGVAMHYSGVGNHDAALRVAAEARALYDRFALHRMQAMVELQEAIAWMIGDAPGEARQLLDRFLASRSPATRPDKPAFDFVSGLVALRMQD